MRRSDVDETHARIKSGRWNYEGVRVRLSDKKTFGHRVTVLFIGNRDGRCARQ
jgi:hypothetical protein